MTREVQDHYFRLAKKEGYRSRAAYKLIEIDDRKKILRPSDAVLDCGAAPGSWMQVAAKRIGPKGIVVGVDLQEIAGTFDANVRLVQDDFTKIAVDELLGLIDARPASSSLRSSEAASARFDVILSDMAPNTTGDRIIDHHTSGRLCESVLDRCPSLLRPGGQLVMKIFEGETYPSLLKRAAGMFEHVRGFKPKASRGESTEIYVVAKGYRGTVGSDQTSAQPAAAAQPKRRPSAGWSKQS